MPNAPLPPNNRLKKWAKYTGMAVEMMAIIAVGTIAGYKIDERREADFPLWTLILSLLAVFAALYLIIRNVIRDSQNED
jgi:F0F1-type ATP synthase assembly protein I